MTERLLIFGNGLGRSIHNEFFQIKNALRTAWNSENVLTDQQRQLISSCLPPEVIEAGNEAPTSEEELEDLQRVLSACDTIKIFQERIDGHGQLWLTDEGLSFPLAIRKYIHAAACYFHDRDVLYFDDIEPLLPQAFGDGLRNFILGTGAHVATLNYDDLLYDCFTTTPIFRNYRLRDGFFGGGGFDMDRGRRLISLDRGDGWFLHLHGSPLFVDEDGVPKKLQRAFLRNYQGVESTHLVLTSVRFKSSIITASSVLKEYWKELRAIVPNMRRIYIIGYGGEDVHLNIEISKASRECEIVVVERNGGRNVEERKDYWSQKFHHSNLRLIQEENILNFLDWE